MEQYKTVCLDLDGTVYKGNEPIPESIAFIRHLQKSGIEPYYVTNNSSKTQIEIFEKLTSFGLITSEDYIITSAIVTAHYIATHHSQDTIQMIGESGLREALLSKELRLVESKGDVVVLGIDHEITYDKLADACLAIRNGAAFYATNGDLALPNEEGLVPGNGAFVELIRVSTGVVPTILGKPEPYMLDFIRKQKNVKKEEMIMIGDNYDTDIQVGIRYGIDTIHLQGGVTSAQELLTKKEAPTYSFKTLAEWK